MKANVATNKTLKVISNTLNEAEFLFEFDLVRRPNRVELNIVTDKKEVQFTCVNPSVMEKLLGELKILSPEHNDDIEELFSELAS